MFRALGKSKVAFVLAILFGLSLFFFKGGSRYSNFFNSDSIVAKVSNTPISTSKFNRVMQMNINNFNQMLGKNMSGDEIRSLNIHSLALNTLINDAVFEDEFNEVNFNIDEKVIALKTKEKIPQLYDSNNKLDEEYLSIFLRQQQLKIEDIVQIINFETRKEFFNDALFNVNFPKYFNNMINLYNNHERKIKFIELEIDKISINEIVEEFSSNQKEELKNFYDNNIENYLSEEKRDVEFILIDKDKISLNFQPTDFELEDYYNTNKDLFYENEKRSFIQLNFKKKSEAEQFKAETNNLEYNEILKYAKLNNIKYNEFENLQKKEILEQISNNLFNLNLYEVSKIIETSLAKHIVIPISITPPRQKNFLETKDIIKTSIIKIETDNFYNDLLNQISEQILNGNSLTNIADFHNIDKKFIRNLTQNYDIYNKKEEKFFKSLLNNSFIANNDFVSNVINVNQNLSYIFNVTNINISKPNIFEEIEEEIFEDWKKSKKIGKINDDVKNNSENIDYITKIADEYNLDIKELTLTKKTNKIPNLIINKIFQAKKNMNIANTVGEKFYILVVEEIIIPNNNNIKNDIFINNDLMASFGKELMKNKKISTNDTLISAIINQY